MLRGEDNRRQGGERADRQAGPRPKAGIRMLSCRRGRRLEEEPAAEREVGESTRNVLSRRNVGACDARARCMRTTVARWSDAGEDVLVFMVLGAEDVAVGCECPVQARRKGGHGNETRVSGSHQGDAPATSFHVLAADCSHLHTTAIKHSLAVRAGKVNADGTTGLGSSVICIKVGPRGNGRRKGGEACEDFLMGPEK